MMRIDKPNSTVDDLLTVMKRFPTGGIIQGLMVLKRRMKQVKVKLLFAEKQKLKQCAVETTNCET